MSQMLSLTDTKRGKRQCLKPKKDCQSTVYDAYSLKGHLSFRHPILLTGLIHFDQLLPVQGRVALLPIQMTAPIIASQDLKPTDIPKCPPVPVTHVHQLVYTNFQMTLSLPTDALLPNGHRRWILTLKKHKDMLLESVNSTLCLLPQRALKLSALYTSDWLVPLQLTSSIASKGSPPYYTMTASIRAS